MSSATSELARKLARRRVGEQVFETVADESSADVVANYAGGVHMEGGQEAVFESATTTSAADAAYCREAAQTHQNSEAFAAALERIRAFERAQDSRSRAYSGSTARVSRTMSQESSGLAQPAGVAAKVGSEDAPPKEEGWEIIEDVSDATASSLVVEEVKESSGLAEPAGVAAQVGSEDAPPKEAERERQTDFKSAVRERFAALILEGLPPNEAAVRAIREATGQQGDGEAGGQQRGADGATGDDARSKGMQRSCASSATTSGVEGQHGEKRAVSVAA